MLAFSLLLRRARKDFSHATACQRSEADYELPRLLPPCHAISVTRHYAVISAYTIPSTRDLPLF